MGPVVPVVPSISAVTIVPECPRDEFVLLLFWQKRYARDGVSADALAEGEEKKNPNYRRRDRL